MWGLPPEGQTLAKAADLSLSGELRDDRPATSTWGWGNPE